MPDLIWDGNGSCEHKWGIDIVRRDRGNTKGANAVVGNQLQGVSGVQTLQGQFCSLCGGWKGQLGLEPTPELYISHLVEIFREVRRVLRKDGVCFVNIGDSYNSPGTKMPRYFDGRDNNPKEIIANSKIKAQGLKTKDLCLIPFRLAIALQEPYQAFTIKELADRAWLAGIVDGEGCIGIHHFERDDRGNHYHSFQPFISVGSIDPPLIERIVRITKMNGTRQKTEPGDMDGRGIITKHANYEWRVEGANAIKVIEDIYPNLTIKRKQARIAYELTNCHTPHTGKGHKVPENITTYKLMLWQMIKDCNQRKDVEVRFPEPIPHIEPGWWVRSVIIWSKPNPMPESVTDRPTESHEYILMLTKSARYFWDSFAVREKADTALDSKSSQTFGAKGGKAEQVYGEKHLVSGEKWINNGVRNLRSVWTFPTQPYPEAHFATYPEELAQRCVLAATPEVGCCSKCGKPWVRIVKKSNSNYAKRKEQGVGGPYNLNPELLREAAKLGNLGSDTKTLGWKPQCNCNADKVPSIVLDPFSGSGTTLKVAAELNRQAIGYELSEKYCKLAVERNKQGIIL